MVMSHCGGAGSSEEQLVLLTLRTPFSRPLRLSVAALTSKAKLANLGCQREEGRQSNVLALRCLEEISPHTLQTFFFFNLRFIYFMCRSTL